MSKKEAISVFGLYVTNIFNYKELNFYTGRELFNKKVRIKYLFIPYLWVRDFKKSD